MTLRHGYVTTWDRLLLIGVGHKKTAEIIKIKISMSQLGAAGSNGLISCFYVELHMDDTMAYYPYSPRDSSLLNNHRGQKV